MKTMNRFLLVALAGALTATGASAQRQSLRLAKTAMPIFPQTQLEAGVVEGNARIAISVDETGQLTDSLAVAYSHRDFARAALRALPDWRFEPMRLDGAPVPSQVDLNFDFKAQGVVLSMDASNVMNFLIGTRFNPQAYAPATIDQLDRIPVPINVVRPRYPTDLADRGVQGRAVVEFYIDESGAVRMPAVVEADFAELGDLSGDAVRQWTFEPPTRHGKPIVTRVRQTFHFRPEDS